MAIGGIGNSRGLAYGGRMIAMADGWHMADGRWRARRTPKCKPRGFAHTSLRAAMHTPYPVWDIYTLCSSNNICKLRYVFWISSKCFTSSHNYENFANLKRTIWKHVIKHDPEKRPFLKDLIPCLHFSGNFKNFENLGGVKLKHLLEIQNTTRFSPQACPAIKWTAASQIGRSPNTILVIADRPPLN